MRNSATRRATSREQSWPTYDERLLVEDEIEIVIQINGKVRDRIRMSALATEEEMKAAAIAHPKIQQLVTAQNDWQGRGRTEKAC